MTTLAVAKMTQRSQNSTFETDTSDWTSGLPKFLKVIGKTFEIKQLQPDQDTDVDGWMKLGQQEIWIRLTNAKEQAQDTALHEAIHAVDESLSLGLKEKQVHALAAGLLALFKDNPEFVTWILK